MKTKLALPLIGLYCKTAAHGASVLLGGFDGSNAVNAPLQDAAATGNFSMSLSLASGALLSSTFNPGAFQQSNFATWGSQTFSPNPQISGSNSVFVVDTSATINFTISNTGTSDITLDSLHWVAKRDVALSPAFATISYISGDLAGSSTTANFGAVGTSGVDFDLTSILTDNILSAGESAVFSWNVVGDDTNNSRLRVDNFAISGAVPEPSTALLGAIGSLLLIRRRR